MGGFQSTKRHKQNGRRPALILSLAIYNTKSGLCLCVPITSKVKGYLFEIVLMIERPSVVLSDQIKSIDFHTRNAEFIKKPMNPQYKKLEAILCNFWEIIKA